MQHYHKRIPTLANRGSVSSIDMQIDALRKSLTDIKDTDTSNKVIDEIVFLTNEKEALIDENRKRK